VFTEFCVYMRSCIANVYVYVNAYAFVFERYLDRSISRMY
jgi:hypothetical protein